MSSLTALLTATSLPEMPTSSSLPAMRRCLARAIAVLSAECHVDPVHRREALQPYVLAYSVAFADFRRHEIGNSVDGDDMRQIARIRALDALDRLDMSMAPQRQLAYICTVVSAAIADAGRAADPLGRLGRNRHNVFLQAVEATSDKTAEDLTDSELDALARKVAGEKARYADFFRCRYGTDPLISQPGFFGVVSVPSPRWDPEQAAIRLELLRAIAAHPDREIREFLAWALTGVMPNRGRNKNVVKRPKKIVERLGPVLSSLLDLDPVSAA